MIFEKGVLEGMKRSDLQKLCKRCGIRANMKTAKLIEELIEHGICRAKENTPLATNGVESKIPEDIITEPCQENKEEKRATPCFSKKGYQKREQKEEKIALVPFEMKLNASKGESKIPRLTVKSKSKTDSGTTPVKSNSNKTPNWAKIHRRQFQKMDSLGDYLDKKRKRAEELGGSSKKVKMLPDEENVVPKKHEKTTEVKCITTTPKPKAVEKKKRLTFNFSQTASFKENAVTPGKIKRRATLGGSKSSNDGVQKSATPFKFSATPNTMFSLTPRKAFDLKASLSKPLPYKPYTGKLPTPPYAKQNKVSSVKKTKQTSHQRDVKGVKVASRKERRDEEFKNKAKRREDAVIRRRGMTKV